MDKFKDECGIVGVSIKGNKRAAEVAFFGLNGIQHRGQESTGLAIANDGQINCFKDDGLVTDVFDDKILSLLQGEICIGHVNCRNEKVKFSNNTQPFLINYAKGSIAVAFNGGIVNQQELRKNLEEQGAIFTTQSSCEIIAYLIARNDKGDIVESIKKTMSALKGGYAFAVLTGDSIIGVRDPLGIRPLALGGLDGGYLLASESCAIELMGGELLTDLNPGEIVIIKEDTVSYIDTLPKDTKRAHCIFEYVYFSRPDSTLDGVNVFRARDLAGRILAKESAVDADIVLGVPDSGTPAAIGYATESGVPYSGSLIKNKYIGRTFIKPTQEQRDVSVRIKLNPIREYVEGKRIILVDDSIVRGTTMRSIIATLRWLGAKEVHLRISSPPVKDTCFFGVETPNKEDLISNQMTKEELAQLLDADSLEYLSLEGLIRSVNGNPDNFCMGCFSEIYPEI